MALFHPPEDQGLVAGESHRLEWLVLCGWPSVPQHGDQAYKVIVKVRIWDNGFYFTLRPDAATPLLGMRATTVREGPDIDETKVRVLSPIMHLFVSLSSTTYSRGTPVRRRHQA